MQNKYVVWFYLTGWGIAGYKHLEFRFVWMNSPYGIKEVFNLNWQADNHTTAKDRWYGCSIKFSSSDLDYFRFAGQILMSLFGGGGIFSVTPADVLELIDGKRNISKAIYDRRLSRYVYVEDLLPKEWGTWGDDANQVSAVAFDERTAADAVQERYEFMVDKGYVSRRQYGSWLADDRPVVLKSSEWGPSRVPRSQILRPRTVAA